MSGLNSVRSAKAPHAEADRHALGVGVGHEPVIFWLTDPMAHVTGADLYRNETRNDVGCDTQSGIARGQFLAAMTSTHGFEPMLVSVE